MSLIAAIAMLTAVIDASGACEAAEPLIAQARQHLEAGEANAAREAADDAIAQSPECVEAHLIFGHVVGQQLDSAGGLRALGLSRRYRRAIQRALEVNPDHVGAREAEIGYLIHAPGIAGGDRERAALRIDDLRRLDRQAAAEAHLDLARANGDESEILLALEALIPLTPDRYALRSEWARRLILAGEYDTAEAELLSWTGAPDWTFAEQNYLRGAHRVLAETDLHPAENLLRLAINADCPENAPRCVNVPNATALLGRALELQGDLTGARAAYSNALESEPDNARALAGLARLNTP